MHIDEMRQECLKKCARAYAAQRNYCEANFSPEGTHPDPMQFHACAIAAVADEIYCMKRCLRKPANAMTKE